MRVLHINTNYEGGAGVACRRIHSALLNVGVDSSILVLRKAIWKEKNVYSVEEKSNKYAFKLKTFINSLQQYFDSKGALFTPVSSPKSLFDISNLEIVKNADIIHLHWVSKMLDYETFFKKINKPIIWTLHDRAPFTGGNHVDFDYDEKKYGKILNKYYAIKQSIFSSFDCIKIVSPSNWLILGSSRSFFSKYEHFLIRNPIDPNTFRQLDRNKLREKFNYRKEDKIVLFISEHLENKNKGINYFLDALNLMKEKRTKVIVIGGVLGKQIDTQREIDFLGSIADPNEMAEFYNIADVFVITSQEENFPNTITESLACGTPVVAFNYSGMKELISHKTTGYLANYQSSEDIANGIEFCLSSLCNEDTREECHQLVIKACNPDIVAKSYTDLYKKVLNHE